MDVSSVAQRVVAGLMEHRSQRSAVSPGVPLEAEEDARWTRAVGVEPLVIAWPPAPPGATLLGDIFEGLD
ncbi:hypothetical protein ABIB35_000633 [Arthrobacter sp. UYP6]|uniref:hypothetical protein n=1 Tax=Arthrobacter sp. UYP6 TaxID=1756378 RepID=UPI0033998EEE